MKVRDVELAVRETGTGLPFLWGHGLMGSMDQEDAGGLFEWGALEQSVRLVRYDARGHGRSEATLEPRGYHWRELARDLRALADVLCEQPSAGPPVLGGVSMGCATSLHAAVAAPEQTRALVLVAPPTAWDSRPRQARIYRMGAAMVERFGLGPFRCMGRLASLAVRDTTLVRMQRSIMDELGRADPRAVTCALRGAAESDLPGARALRKLDVPTLILAWRRDPTHPLSTAERLAELLPDAELHVADSSEDIRAWPARMVDFLESRITTPDSRASG